MKFSLSSILMLALLAGCSAGKGGSETIIVTPAPSQPQVTSEQGGSSEGGGGNGIGGQALEDYMVDIRTLPEYQSTVLEIIKNLETTAPRLAADFLYLSREKDWYFLPASLDPISEQSIGTAFKTDQIAVQERYDVWIDSRLYDPMSTESKSKLLIHELLMGVKILGYDKRYDICLSKNAGVLLQPSGEKAYADARSQCQIKTGNLPGVNIDGSEKAISITDDDYALIRKMADLIYEDGGNLGDFDIQAEFKARGFRDYTAD